jgi:hypothetical protein
MSNELVIEFKDGSRDWFDPIEKRIIRPYSEWTTYDFIDSENPTQPKESK